MTDPHIREATSHVATAAAQFESLVNEVRIDYREGRFDREPVGSPAYVRRLRDQAAVAALPSFTMNKSSSLDEDADNSLWAAEALVRALGYEPPGDDPKETQR